jgi:hypothetical protein
MEKRLNGSIDQVSCVGTKKKKKHYFVVYIEAHIVD